VTRVAILWSPSDQFVDQLEYLDVDGWFHVALAEVDPRYDSERYDSVGQSVERELGLVARSADRTLSKRLARASGRSSDAVEDGFPSLEEINEWKDEHGFVTAADWPHICQAFAGYRTTRCSCDSGARARSTVRTT